MEEDALMLNSRFLVANLQMRLIRQAENMTDLRQILARLPEDLDRMYDHTLERIEALSSKRSKLAMNALCWVVFCDRRLTIEELRHALATTPRQKKFNREDLHPASDITDFCLGLLSITENTQEVALMHYSAQSHFQEVLRSRFPAFDAKIVQICITHLGLDELEQLYYGRSYSDSARHHGMYAQILVRVGIGRMTGLPDLAIRTYLLILNMLQD